jgi:hypothetical protein
LKLDVMIKYFSVIHQYLMKVTHLPRHRAGRDGALRNLPKFLAPIACQHQPDVLVNPRFAPDAFWLRANC